MSPEAPTPRARTGGRRRWFNLHSWVGLKFSLLFFFVSLTGTLAVYAYELDWLFTPALRVQAPESGEGAERQPPGTLLAAALKEYPGWRPSFMYLNLPDYMAAELIAVNEDGERRRIYVNPYTAEVQGHANWYNAHRFLREAHRHLMLPLQWGLTIVTLLSFPLLLSMISAFPIFKRWWRGFFKPPKPRDPPRRWWGNLHRWLGLWSLPFILVIGLTGIWYLVEKWGGAAPAAGAELRPLPEANALPRDADTLNRAIERALKPWPEYQLDSLWFPGENQPLILQGQEKALLVRPRANTLLIDPTTGESLGRVHGEQLSLHQRIAEAADPLHFGTFGGQPTRFLWFLFGLMLTTLAASGTWIYSLRLTSGRSHRSRRAGKPKGAPAVPHLSGVVPRSPWRTLWQGQLLPWPQMALILTCLILALVNIGS
ncbi:MULTISPECIES: PepSY-associated TM helix domain-containing protein [Marinimicrobium]|uniref:Putative iron-regulated membrane protein n=1 Tax=Marinimicrobium koreense TaxID=306545 RepID=A0A3N1NMJ2_9GAMM|nr:MULTISPECIES: PepSY-associated TM helix domain-containing protein [Marinimicrobium]ROQ17069.1 putative iron-regulated membrane protein [Marinimicrobium koreense]